MIEVPHQVLSEHFEERMRGRRLLHAVFTTFQFEPFFFEQEVLPVFFDLNFSHVPVIRAVQMEEALRESGAKIAVYYDANGLLAAGDGSAKLDVVRIPVRHRTGIFHPKNVLALVEEVEPDESGAQPRTLLVAAMSANLTKAGWWQNVEACHVEEVGEQATTRLRSGLLDYIRAIRERSPDGVDHAALDTIHEHVKRTTQHAHRSLDGDLRPHFFGGTQSFMDFLIATAGDDLRGLNLEVISPFFDKDDESGPLKELLRRFKPVETRILLPRNDAGDAKVPEALYEWVRTQEAVSWGRLPGELTRTSNNDTAKARNVHAKVYRFFRTQPKLEYLVIGSVNLTRPAHQQGGNVETAILVQTGAARRPQFWLEVDGKKPREFVEPDDADGDTTASTAGSRLAIRYDWRAARAAVHWDEGAASSALQIVSAGVELFRLETVPPRTWQEVDGEAATSLRKILGTTSFVDVVGDRKDAVTILVLEDGMWKKPPLLARLSVQDILRYWSLLTPEQRNEFMASHADLHGDAAPNQLVTRTSKAGAVDSIFDRFAGFFHAFECMKEAVRTALDRDNEKEACYRLFGTKHDSLGSLLDRVRTEADRDLVDRYVIAMCARQLCDELRRTHKGFWSEHAAEVTELQTALAIADEVRAALQARDPEAMPPFLEWFDRRFLSRAQPPEVP